LEKRNATAAVIGAGDYIGAAIAKKFAAEASPFSQDAAKATN
jgi:NAD(P)-dependent dehydrogenase (short-subunit alcohol dehydrogenase family)